MPNGAAHVSQLDKYKRKRVEALQNEIEEIQSGSSASLQGKRRKSEREREEKLLHAARRRDWSVHIAEVDRQKELDDIADWWKVEAKRTKEETYAKICDSIGAPSRPHFAARKGQPTPRRPRRRLSSSSSPPPPPPPPPPRAALAPAGPCPSILCLCRAAD